MTSPLARYWATPQCSVIEAARNAFQMLRKKIEKIYLIGKDEDVAIIRQCLWSPWAAVAAVHRVFFLSHTSLVYCTLSSLGRRFVFVNELEVVQSNSKLAVEHMCETLLAAVLCVDELRNGIFFSKTSTAESILPKSEWFYFSVLYFYKRKNVCVFHFFSLSHSTCFTS